MNTHEAPAENFRRGIKQLDLPWLGPKIEGKVRDNWIVERPNGERWRVLFTSDRISAFDVVVGNIEGKGAALNAPTIFWSKKTTDIIPNDLIASPHPNIIVARQAVQTLPVEVVVREYMAETTTSTSVYVPYMKGERNIYGYDFPDGLRANQKLPMGMIVTPTTKAEKGEHDKPLTNEQAQEIVDKKFGDGVWEQAKQASLMVFKRGSELSVKGGLILVDTKFEFGIDSEGNLMLIDEKLTADSSRYWSADTYQERFDRGEKPQGLDKEFVRNWLADNGFTGKEGQKVPVIPGKIHDEAARRYRQMVKMLTGQDLPPVETDPKQMGFTVMAALGL